MRRYFLILFALAATLAAQTATRSRVIGIITSIDAKGGTVKPDSGEPQSFGFLPETKIQKVAPGEKDLAKAQVIQPTDIQVGDRVRVLGVPAENNAGIIAQSVVVMSSGDIAQKQQQERMEWQKRGVGGLVVAADTAANEIKIKIPSLMGGEATTLTVALDAKTRMRRYAPDSVKFSDAKTATLAEVKAGDQLRALGNKSEDGTRLTAEEVVTGSFQTMAGTVTSVNVDANEILVKELGTNKPITVKVTADSNLRKMFSFGGGGMPGGGMPGAGAPGGMRPPGGPAAGGPGGMGGGRRPDAAQMMERLPKAILAEIKPGESIVVASTRGASADRITAITLLANADVIIAMQQQKSQQPGGRANGAGPGMGSWNMGEMSMIPMQ
ncbi:MAG: hypothetical protein ABI693_28470 [Bryobacteraceae bacterium]